MQADSMTRLLERRRFLTRLMRAAATASIAGVATGCRLDDRRGSGSDSDTDQIVVIGAGVAGLSAARALTDAGRNVMILEARPRLGGRTFTDSVGEASVDLGGAWMHGVGHTPLRAVVDAAGLRYDRHVLEPDGVYDESTGSPLNMVQLLHLQAVLSGFDSQRLKAYTTPGASVADGIQEFLGRLDLAAPTQERARFALEALYSSAAGRIDRQAIREFDLEWPYQETWGEVDEEDFVIRGGYRTLIEYLARGVNVRLDTTVQKIVHGANGVRISTEHGVVRGHHAIVTVPLGVLKSGSIEFEPRLPAEKRGAIQRVGFGAFEKVVLTYPTQFWKGRIGVSTYYAGTGPNRAYPLFIDMTPFSGAPTLVCLYAGQFAHKAQSTLDDAAIISGAHRAVTKIMGGTTPEPTAALATRWHSDPFAQGSYSFQSIESREDDRESLAKPVGTRLLFAGEATSAAMAATVDGALMSGLREARRIVPSATLPGIR